MKVMTVFIHFKINFAKLANRGESIYIVIRLLINTIDLITYFHFLSYSARIFNLVMSDDGLRSFHLYIGDICDCIGNEKNNEVYNSLRTIEISNKKREEKMDRCTYVCIYFTYTHMRILLALLVYLIYGFHNEDVIRALSIISIFTYSNFKIYHYFPIMLVAICSDVVSSSNMQYV